MKDVADEDVQRVQEVFAGQLVPAVATLHPPRTPPDHIAERAALVATQVLGMALCRYVLSIPPVAAMERTTVSAWLGPTPASGTSSAPPEPI